MPILPTGPTQVTKTGNVGSVDVFRVAHLFTFCRRGQGNALRGSEMVSKNQQKIGEANGMPILPTGPTQVTKTGNVGSVDVLGGPSIHIRPQVAGYCTERVVNCLKKSAKNWGSQCYAQSAHCAHTGRVKEKCVFSGCS